MLNFRGRGSSTFRSSSTPARARRHNQNPVRQENSFLDAVRNEDNRVGNSEPQLLQVDVHLLARECIERAKRLIHDQETGVLNQRATDRNALAHAAGKLVRVFVREARKPDLLQGGCSARFANLTRPIL